MAKAFKTHIAAEIDRICRREKLTQDKAFLFWFARSILELSDDDAREAISVEGANDKGIDLFWVDNDEGRVIIAQGKYSPKFSFRPKIAHVTNLESSVNWLRNPEALTRDGKTELAQAAQDYITATGDGFGIELWFVYTGDKCPNIDKHINVYNQNSENVENRRTIRHYHGEILEATWQELEGVSRRIEQETISIGVGDLHHFNGDFGNALVVSVPGSEIVRLYKKHEERLFDRNVRLFLGVRKGSVNAGIAETLRDNAECNNFWAYNNGLTIICDSFKAQQESIELHNFSIVNGCQTAVSMAQGPQGNLTRVSVLVRIIAASGEIVDEIIRYTNSQNPIRTWDIASQDRTQRRLKAGFSKLAKPFIYLTRRGTRPTGDLRKYRESGKLRQVRIDIMGQYAAAFRVDPVLAYKHKAFIFSRHHDEAFPPDVRVEEVLFQWVCGEAAREVVQAAIRQKGDDEIRILKKGGTLFVLAAMSKVLSLRNGSTYLSNCTQGAILSKTAANRLKKYAQYALDTYVQAVIDQRQLENAELPTLIRQPEFHRKITERIARQYEKEARASQWIKDALPPITLTR